VVRKLEKISKLGDDSARGGTSQMFYQRGECYKWTNNKALSI
jgi:hypothetical protein